MDLLCDKLSNLLRDLLFVLQLVVDFCCGLAVGFRLVVDLLYNITSCTTNPRQIEAMERRVCRIVSISCGFVVQLVVTACCTIDPQQVEANGVRHITTS